MTSCWIQLTCFLHLLFFSLIDKIQTSTNHVMVFPQKIRIRDGAQCNKWPASLYITSGFRTSFCAVQCIFSQPAPQFRYIKIIHVQISPTFTTCLTAAEKRSSMFLLATHAPLLAGILDYILSMSMSICCIALSQFCNDLQMKTTG